MKIETFATLEAVLQSGTFVGGSRVMNVTPSAVSMQMKQLEVYLGKPLFDRSGLQARPTRLAHDVADIMRDALKEFESLRAGSAMAIEGALRLGVIESMQPVLLPGIMRFLKERHPKVDLRPARGRSTALTAQVKAGELDAALVAEPPSAGVSRLRWTPMLSSELVLVAPLITPDASVAALFRQHDWIRYDRNTVSGVIASQYVAAHVGDIRGTLEFDSAPAIVAMVSAGLGISILQRPDAAALQNYPVRIIRLGRAAPVLQLSMVTRKADDDSRLIEVIREGMRLTFANHQRQHKNQSAGRSF